MAAMGMPIAVYLPPFYSEHLGLSLATVGLVFFLARIWDVVTDPIMGFVIDRYDTRWGRRKHWIALSIPLLLLSVWMVFIPDPAAVSGPYLLFWLIALYVGYTMLAIAHQSWGADLSTTYNERSRLFGWREIFVIGGMTAVLALPALLDALDRGDTATKVASMGWFCLVLFPVTVLPTLLMVPDTNHTTRVHAHWRETFSVLKDNPLLWRLLATDLFSGFGTGIAGALYIFVAAYVFELREQASLALLFYFLASFLAMPLWMKLAYKVGKDVAIKIALIYGALMVFLLLFYAEPGNAFRLWAFTILYGVAYGATPTLLRSMMADLTDYDEWRVGTKRAGLYFALLTTTNKLGAAIAVGASFMALEWFFGFMPGQANSATAVNGLLWVYTIGTAVGLLAGVFSLKSYTLNEARHNEIRSELDARAALSQTQ